MAKEYKEVALTISIHALREEGDLHCWDNVQAANEFLSTPSARRATLSFPTRPRFLSNFYPRPPRGGRLTPPADRDEGWKFLSTPSARRATMRAGESPKSWGYFYPRPPRGGRPFWNCLSQKPLSISIHALREEGDGAQRQKADGCNRHFYPRPPRGGRLVRSGVAMILLTFLSTPSARRATENGSCSEAAAHYFYPRPPRGGRPPAAASASMTRSFLSTPSARRATKNLAVRHLLLDDFYPRPPRGGRPAGGPRRAAEQSISIHALREEGDLTYHHLRLFHMEFLSTPSARRATFS